GELYRGKDGDDGGREDRRRLGCRKAGDQEPKARAREHIDDRAEHQGPEAAFDWHVKQKDRKGCERDKLDACYPDIGKLLAEKELRLRRRSGIEVRNRAKLLLPHDA